MPDPIYPTNRRRHNLICKIEPIETIMITRCVVRGSHEAHAWTCRQNTQNRRHGELRHKRKGVCLCVCYELFDVDAFGVCPETAESGESGPMMRSREQGPQAGERL